MVGASIPWEMENDDEFGESTLHVLSPSSKVCKPSYLTNAYTLVIVGSNLEMMD